MRRASRSCGPLQSTGDNLLAGANMYKDNCAFCHGLPDHPATVGRSMYPGAPQLWRKHKNGMVGVSDDPPGETFWRVRNGIRLTGCLRIKRRFPRRRYGSESTACFGGEAPAEPQ